MADVSKTIEIIFAGNDQITKVVKGLETSFDGLQDIAGPIADLGNAILAIDAGLAAVAVSIGMVQQEMDASGAKMQAALGVSAEKAGELNDIAKELFANNFGESISENAAVVTDAFRRMGDVGDEELGGIVTKAIMIQDAFGAETNQTLAATQTLMREFGLSSEQAFDFVAAGFQKGLDSSGDFLESITEYGTQFSNGGADAGQFFSVMETGMANGILGTDKAADSFKEFRVRLLDGSKTTSEALAQLGIDSKGFLDSVSSGTTSTADAYGIVLKALQDTGSEAIKMQAGVGLLGTQFEDLGTRSVLGIDLAKTSIDGLAGAADGLSVQYDTLGNAITGAFRRIVTELADLKVFDDIKDDARKALDEITSNLPAAFNAVDFSGLTASIDDIADAIKNMFGDDIDITSIEGLAAIIQGVVDSIETMVDVTRGMAEPWIPVINILKDAIQWLNSLDDGSKELVGNLLGVSQQIVVVGGVVTGLVGSVKALSIVFSGLGTAATSALGIAGQAGLLGIAGAAGWMAGDLVREYVPAVDKGSQALLGWVDSLINFSGTQGDANETIEAAQAKIRSEVEEFKQLKTVAGAAGDKIKDIPGEVSIDIGLDVGDTEEQVSRIKSQFDGLRDSGEIVLTPSYAGDEFNSIVQGIYDQVADIPVGLSVDEFKAQIDTLVSLVPESETITVKTEIDERAAEYARGYLEDVAPDGTRTFTWVGAVDSDALKKTKEVIEKEIPPEKKLQIETDLQIAQIEADSKEIDALLKYKAEVDIADIEANAEKIKAAFGSVNVGLESTGNLLGELFGGLDELLGKDATSAQLRNALLEQIKKENELRERQVNLQEELAQAQVDYMNARINALESGSPLIQVEAGNLTPALEMIFINILELCQVRANQEGVEALIGL